MRAIWKSSIYGRKTKIKLFSAIVKSTLLYGSECWTLTQKLEKKLRVFQQRCFRRVLNIYYPNLVSNEEVLRRAGQTDIITDLTKKKWRWVGHVARKEPEHLTRQAFCWRAEGRRRRGRPRLTWKRVVDREMVEAMGMSFEEALDQAQD